MMPFVADKSRPRLRVAVYVGWHRWCDWRRDDPDDPDEAVALLEGLERSGHRVCALLLRRGDRLAPWAARLDAPLLTLPAALCHPFPALRRAWAGGAWNTRRSLRRWLKALAATRPDLGFVSLGGWIPPPVAATPRQGFINYHPAPLPDLPGLYPEVLMALRGQRAARGTFHRVASGFDTGEILAYTAATRLPARATARELCARLLRSATPALPGLLDGLAAGTLDRPRPRRVASVDASTKAVNRETRIDWMRDDAPALAARMRALACGRNEGHWPLHAEVGGAEAKVLGVEIHGGMFPGRPGETLGRYRGAGRFRGAFLVRMTDGLAVVATGGPFQPGQRARRPPAWVAGGVLSRTTRREDFAFFGRPPLFRGPIGDGR